MAGVAFSYKKMLDLNLEQRIVQLLKKIVREVISFVCVYSGIAMLFYLLKIRPQRDRYRILVYHRVNNQRHYGNPVARSMSVRGTHFKRQMKFLNKYFNVISIDYLTDVFKQNEPLPERALAITFDDGYRDNYLNAFPLLKKYQFPATIFLTTGFIGTQKSLWWDHLQQIISRSTAKAFWQFSERTLNRKFNGVASNKFQQLVDHLKSVDNEARDRFIEQSGQFFQIEKEDDDIPAVMLTPANIKEMSDAGISFGSHTVSHLILSKVSELCVRQELAESKQDIEEITGREVCAFAYPNGGLNDFNQRSIELLRDCGYQCAFMNVKGVNKVADDPFTLKRIGVYGTDSMSSFICRCFGIF